MTSPRRMRWRCAGTRSCLAPVLRRLAAPPPEEVAALTKARDEAMAAVHAALGAVIDMGSDEVRFKAIGQTVRLRLLPSGHYELPISEFPANKVMDLAREPTHARGGT